jgi:hypothetical protein
VIVGLGVESVIAVEVGMLYVPAGRVKTGVAAWVACASAGKRIRTASTSRLI